MIVNNLGDESMQDQPLSNTQFCVATFTNTRTLFYEVSSSDGVQIQGSMPPSAYVELTPNGKPPYTVAGGTKDHSLWVEAEGLAATDAVSFLLLSPITGIPSGGLTTLVNKSASA